MKLSLSLFIFLYLSFSDAGKILNDDVPLKEYKIDEKNFVVVMVTKVRAVSVILSAFPFSDPV